MRTRPIITESQDTTTYNFGEIKVKKTNFFVTLVISSVSSPQHIEWSITHTEAEAIAKSILNATNPTAIPDVLTMLEANGIHGGDVYDNLKKLLL